MFRKRKWYISTYFFNTTLVHLSEENLIAQEYNIQQIGYRFILFYFIFLINLVWYNIPRRATHSYNCQNNRKSTRSLVWKKQWWSRLWIKVTLVYPYSVTYAAFHSERRFVRDESMPPISIFCLIIFPFILFYYFLIPTIFFH